MNNATKTQKPYWMQKKLDAARQEAQALGYPELIGTPGQIDFAITTRQDLLDTIAKRKTDCPRESWPAINRLVAWIIAHRTAKWFIEHRKMRPEDLAEEYRAHQNGQVLAATNPPDAAIA